MAAIRLHAVVKQFGPQVVLDDVSLELNEGEIVGLVGANGSGKTTIFRLIAGEFPPDSGTITISRVVDVGYLKQEPDVALDRNLYDEVGSTFDDLLSLERRLHGLADQIAAKAHDPDLHRWMEEYERVNGQFLAAGGHTFETRLNECLGGLGFSQSDYRLPMSVLSGGQKCRAALAKLLLKDRRFLLLDEPTNHLDIDAVRWLEKFLAGHHGGAVIVSHDRYFLDRLCMRILELDRRRVHSYSGNYSTYVQTKEVQLLTQERQFEKDKEFIEKERAFIAKHLAGQRSKEAQGRRTRLERRMSGGEFVTEGPATKRRARLSFDAESDSRQGTVLRCDDLTMVYGEKVLFVNLSFQVPAGERFAVTGPNGTGKSTLLKIILGQVAPAAGEVELDRKRIVGYYAQEETAMDPERTVLEEFMADRIELTEQTARSILGRYLFTGEQVFKKLGMLSGGEQSRLRLAKLIQTGPDLLILDEPTNHLDIPSREVLEEALQAFAGTVIVVSHDRYFLDRVVDRLLVIRPTGHAIFPGNYSFYIEQMEKQRESEAAQIKAVPSKKRKGLADGSRKERSPYDHLSLEELESMIMDREVELNSLHERFGDPSLYKNPEELEDVQDRTEELGEELERLNAAWEERVQAQ